MDDDYRRRARLALDLLEGVRPDDDLAAALGGADEAAECLARLTGFVVALLAERRREPFAQTVRFVAESLERR